MDAVGEGWVTRELPFTLNALKYPDDEEKIVLNAISQSARQLPREPGAKIHATPLSRPEMQPERLRFFAGYLPLSAPTDAFSGLDSGRSPD